jgi:hypothetical protein
MENHLEGGQELPQAVRSRVSDAGALLRVIGRQTGQPDKQMWS